MEKYEIGEVGISRHPETYGTETLTAPVFTTVDEELAMWESAERIVEDFKKRCFTVEQEYFIWHYVNHLMGRDNLEELKWFEFMKFRLLYARMKELTEKEDQKQ